MKEFLLTYGHIIGIVIIAIWLFYMGHVASSGPPPTPQEGVTCAYKGAGIGGFPILCRFEDNIYSGGSPIGLPLYSIQGNTIYKGAGIGGFPVVTVDSGGYIMEGAIGKYLGIIIGKSVYEFQTENKSPIASSDDKMLLAVALFHV